MGIKNHLGWQGGLLKMHIPEALAWGSGSAALGVWPMKVYLDKPHN